MKNIVAEGVKKMTLKFLPTYGSSSGDKHNSEDQCYKVPVSSGSHFKRMFLTQVEQISIKSNLLVLTLSVLLFALLTLIFRGFITEYLYIQSIYSSGKREVCEGKKDDW